MDQLAHTSPSTRSRVQLQTAKLVKKARESRYLGGGANESVFGDSSRGSTARSTTTMGEEEMDEELRKCDDDWYTHKHPLRGRERQPYARDLTYVLSYSPASLDWDSLQTSLFESSVAHQAASTSAESESLSNRLPHAVLDVGCGSGHWIMSQALVPGWEETTFVGLDAQPPRFTDDLLPSRMAGRISYVQHDFRDKPLPFADNLFDYVRLSRLNLAIPETNWGNLLEECARVLTPGSALEIVEVDFAVYQGNPELQKAFESVLEHQFINSRPLTVIPSNLALVTRNMKSTGRLSIQLPARHPPRDMPPLACEPQLFNAPLVLKKFAAGVDPSVVVPETTCTARIVLHAYAGAIAASSYGFAGAALEIREEQHHGDPDENEHSEKRATMVVTQRERETERLVRAIDDWADDLRERAGFAQIVTDRLGWQPTFDLKLERQLSTMQPLLNDRLSSFAHARRKRSSLFGGQRDPDLEFRFQQADLAKRECEHELRAVRRRLEGRAGTRPEAEATLGSLDFEVFVARAP
ncbi:class I SAM-dependent methyltransferase [Sporobolomyces koalae]|uniref:class I SAM-dependent methyltransferase n=1 Tax=Sporobolomyces koalae TaxID=500713 RepID=UPI003173EBE0